MLTGEQTQRLFNFVRSKYVRYYDLQAELVDHLASSIEEKMEADKDLNFDRALQEVYASFGIYGFSKIVMEKETAMNRQGMKLWYGESFRWFRWPKIAATILLFLAILEICKWIPVLYVTCGFSFFSIVAAAYYHFKRPRTGLRKDTKLLMLSPFKISFFQVGYGCGIIPFYLCFMTYHLGLLSLAWLRQNPWPVALWIALCLLLMVSHEKVYQRLVNQAKIMYPAAFSA